MVSPEVRRLNIVSRDLGARGPVELAEGTNKNSVDEVCLCFVDIAVPIGAMSVENEVVLVSANAHARVEPKSFSNWNRRLGNYGPTFGALTLVGKSTRVKGVSAKVSITSCKRKVDLCPFVVV